MIDKNKQHGLRSGVAGAGRLPPHQALVRSLALFCLMVLAAAWAPRVEALAPLILTEAAAEEIRSNKGGYPLFEKAWRDAEQRVEASIEQGPVVPLPVDPGGGYTHERHKENYKIIHDAGLLFAVTGKTRYADHVRDELLAYAAFYEGLPLHPARGNTSAPGRLFWQSLNETVWLVYAIQGYAGVRDALNERDRATIEQGLLRPMAEFLSAGSAQTFELIHNHATWAAAAVGMTGYALGDEDLVRRALLGLKGDGSSGFLAQLDQLFSPDGYYTEGPYYQRYAMMPFVLFAQAIDHNEPGRKIFDHRNGVLRKAMDAAIQQTYADKFIPVNDALKEKGLDTMELVYVVSAAYGLSRDPGLLSIARKQGTTVLTGEGLAVARDLAAGKARPYAFRSMMLRDGADGTHGALSILRMGEGELAPTAVFKATAQGMGHGHFDRLNLLYFAEGHEVLKDYGAARFLNVPSKHGGRYLPENKSWARQTVAHNALVVNERSQYGGDWKRGEAHWPDILFYEVGDRVNIVAARSRDAYPGTVFKRTVIQLATDDRPLLIDFVDAESEAAVRYDLPFWYGGHIVDIGFDYEARKSALEPLGEHDGYEHLWLEAQGAVPDSGPARVSWLQDRRFYSLHLLSDGPAEVAFVRVGAHDPEFNLRHETGLMLRAAPSKARRFLNVLEPHGDFDPAREVTVGAESGIESITHRRVQGMDLIGLQFKAGKRLYVALSGDPDAEKRHRIEVDGRRWQWTGFYKVFEE